MVRAFRKRRIRKCVRKQLDFSIPCKLGNQFTLAEGTSCTRTLLCPFQTNCRLLISRIGDDASLNLLAKFLCQRMKFFESRLYYLKCNRARLSKKSFVSCVNENECHFSFHEKGKKKKNEKKELARIFAITSIQFSKNFYISNILYIVNK